MRVDLSNLQTIYAFIIFSSTPHALSSSKTSKTRNSSKIIFFLHSTLPNTSLFHLFKSIFKALNWLAKMKLSGEPWK
jgi:hypothetical protein